MLRRLLRKHHVSVELGCIWFGHRYSTASYPPACIRCGRLITHPLR